jgi:hypothetical protein
MLIPEVAIGANLAQQYVLVVGPDDVVQLKPITPGTQYGQLRAVEGINPDDRVITKGLVSARPGMMVRPSEVPIQWDPAASQPSTHPVTTMPAGGGARS